MTQDVSEGINASGVVFQYVDPTVEWSKNGLLSGFLSAIAGLG